MDPLADALNVIKTKEHVGQSGCVLRPASKQVREVLGIMQEHGYVGQYEFIDDGAAGKFQVQLLGNVNNCGVIKPRFAVKFTEWEKWEKRYLPSKAIGLIIVSTPQGIMTHRQAKERHIGGRLMAYVY